MIELMSLPDKAAALLQKYMDEIELFNDAYGLVKAASRQELYVKHILDSLAPLEIIIQNMPDTVCSIADIGSGAGLPGIPLAICLPAFTAPGSGVHKFTLIERMGRRAGFLYNCISVLGLSNACVEEADFEKAGPARFDIAVFRALKPLGPDFLKKVIRLLKPGGFLAAWKGRYKKAREEMLEVEKSLSGLKWEIIPLKVPSLEEERHLVLIRP